ncbi:MAG: FAD-dependent monooxygenase [Pseudomonadota bacterium]
MLDQAYSVAICGAGIVGKTLALALADAGVDQIAIIDPGRTSKAQTGDDGRASAIAAAVARMFDTLDIWPGLADVAQPITSMDITDSSVDDPIRPVFLSFDGAIETGEPFAHMVPNAQMETVLDDMVEQNANIKRITARVLDLTVHDEFAELTLQSGSPIHARLVVGADGIRSSVRQKANIRTVGWPYDQYGLVATISHENPHDGRAEEHFLPSGPFAILPLTGNRSSLVWTEKKPAAEHLLALSDEDLHAELKQRVPPHYGEVEITTPVQAYPLSLQLARSYIAPRIALVGDAAHSIHPLAGQGLNLGLRDVAALSEVIVENTRIGIDPGSLIALEKYQQWRRFDVIQFAAVTDILHRIFAVDNAPFRMVRDFGLGLTDRLPGLKRMMISEAAGTSGDAPRLLRGEFL